MNIKEEIKRLRAESGLSREKLAQMCGLTSMTIYRAETKGNITVTNYLKILNTLKNANTVLNSSL